LDRPSTFHTPSLFGELDQEIPVATKKKRAKKTGAKTARGAIEKKNAVGKKKARKKAGSKRSATRTKAESPGSDGVPRRRATAETMATRQREISVSEFFTKNRHLLGFDSPLKAILTTVKEAVDNSLDACEEAGILPEISVGIVATGPSTFRVSVEDNGPGIVKEQTAKIFGKLLYGSKFHKLSQSRGQQGIGIAAAGMYGQLTTGKPVRIVTRTGSKRTKAHEFLLTIDTARNKPDIHKDTEVDWDHGHGTRVEIEMEGKYQKGTRSVDMYVKQTAIANPHLTLHYADPSGSEVTFERTTRELPPETAEIKPHPHGVELGRLIAMLKETRCRSLSGFLQEEFCRVGPKVAKEIISKAGLSEKAYPTRTARGEASSLHDAIESTRISSPPTTCIAPIGEELVLAGLKKEIDADFYVAATRPASVYRGNPFQIEVGLAYGKPGGVGLEMTDEGRIRKKAKVDVTEDLVGAADEPIRVLRFANRVPLLYQQSGCAITKGVIQTNWRSYGLQQPRGTLPVGPMVLLIHIASVWVPFTSESKEAIASYEEILKEIKLGLRECGRKLGTHVRKGKRLKREFEKRSYIEKYIPHVGLALQEILDLSDRKRDETTSILEDVLHKSRKF